MIKDYTDDFVVRSLPAFFLDYCGPAFLTEQQNEIKVCLPNLTRYFTNNLLVAASKNLLFAYIEDGKIVGLTYADASLNDIYKLEKPVISGAFTYVHPDYRRRGIATQLRSRLLESIKEQGYKIVFAQIYDSNLPSCESMAFFFEKIPHTKFSGYKVEL